MLEKLRANQLKMRPKTIQSSRKVKSEVWLLFHEIVDTSNSKVISNFVRCSKCNEFQEYNGSSTTQLNRHKCSKPQQTLDLFVKSNKTKIKEEDFEKVKNACVKFITKDIRPYYAVEGDGFFDLMICMINIGMKYPYISESEIEKLIPSRNTVKGQVEKFAGDMKSKITNYFRQALEYTGGFSATTDLWSDDFKNNTYICLTAHINLFENKKIVSKRFIMHLNKFDAITKSGPLLEKEIIEIFEEFGVSEQCLKSRVVFVTDRGPNIKLALNKFQRIYCFAHIVNNIVEDMCKHADVKKLITDAASLVKFIKSANLNHRCKPTLKSYTKTRWNTVYEMLNSIYLNYSNIIEILNEKERLTNENYVERITNLSKFQIKEVTDFLKIFKDITDDVEGEKYVTLYYVVPSFERIQKELSYINSDLHIIEEMKERGRNYISSRKNEISPTMRHKVALFLHPLFKSLRICSINDKIAIHSHIKELIENENGNQHNLLVATNTHSIDVTIDTSSYLEDYVDEDEIVSLDLDEFGRYVDFKIKKVSKC